MFAILIIAVVLCVGVCRYAASRYAAALASGGRERVPTAHTGAEIARLFFAFEGVHDVEVLEHSGVASDYFDPARRRLFLQPEIAQGTTMAAWAVALHEAAHATQEGDALGELKWRQTVIRLNRYGPIFAAAGAVAMMLLRLPPRFALLALIAVCALLLLLNIGTLAIEFNANARLRRFLEKHLEKWPTAQERLEGYLSAVATREVGDMMRSPRYFFFSGLLGGGKIRPTQKE